MKVEFTIPGKALGKQRPRMTRRGRVFTPQKTINFENLVKMCYQQERGEVYLEGALRCVITVYKMIPKAMPKYKRVLALEGKLRPQTTPDWDNIGKIICDALNKIAYDDDKQICSATVDKYYSEREYTIVMLEELE